MAVLELTEAEATARLTDMTAATCHPELTEAEVARLLEGAKMPDRWGLQPSDDGWVPSWELNSAAAQGWLMKAGRAASDVTFTADGASYNRSDLIAHCRDMAAQYQARVVYGVSHRERLDDSEVLP